MKKYTITTYSFSLPNITFLLEISNIWDEQGKCMWKSACFEFLSVSNMPSGALFSISSLVWVQKNHWVILSPPSTSHNDYLALLTTPFLNSILSCVSWQFFTLTPIFLLWPFSISLLPDFSNFAFCGQYHLYQ